MVREDFVSDTKSIAMVWNLCHNQRVMTQNQKLKLMSSVPIRNAKRYVCENCSSEFSSQRFARYCSPACKQQAYRDRQRAGLAVELSQLLERYKTLISGNEHFVHDVSYPGYRRRSLRHDVLSRQYQAIQFCLTGHRSNQGCFGIFESCASTERDLILWMILTEVVASLSRFRGGSVHQESVSYSNNIDTDSK